MFLYSAISAPNLVRRLYQFQDIQWCTQNHRLQSQSRRRSFDLRPLIEPHVRISRIRLSDGVAPLQGVRATLSSHQPPTSCFNTQTFSAIGVASFSWKYLRRFPTWFAHLSHLSFSFAKAGSLRIVSVLSSRLLPAIHWHWHHRYYESVRLLAPHHSGFPIRLYLPYLFRGRYEISLGRLTNLSSSSRP
jgi:hypothetical protein